MYIDPGAGWLALQAAVAALLAVPFLFRRSILRAFRRLQGKPDPDQVHTGPDRSNDPGGKGAA